MRDCLAIVAVAGILSADACASATWAVEQKKPTNDAQRAIDDLTREVKVGLHGKLSEAVAAIEKSGAAEKVLPMLLKTLSGDADEFVRCNAALALGRIDADVKTTVPALVQALSDKQPNVRACAAVALGDIGPPAKSSLLGLGRRLNDKETGARMRAAEAILKVDGPSNKAALSVLVAALKEYGLRSEPGDAEEAEGHLTGLGRPIVPVLIDLLGHENTQVRAAATVSLGRIGPGHVAEQIGEIGPAAETAVPALIATLKHKSDFARRWAAQALGSIGPKAETAIPALIELRNDKHFYVREAAAEALQKINR